MMAVQVGRGWLVWTGVFALLFLLAACGPGAPVPTLTLRPAAVLPTRMPPTAGPSPTLLPTVTPTPSITPSPTPTPLATDTPFSTDTATPTATPTVIPSARTEDFMIRLVWESTGNVDLGVQEPGGTLLSALNPTSASGGTFGSDANDSCNTAITDPVEEVVWVAGTALAGQYTILTSYLMACGNEGPLDAALTLLLGDAVLHEQPLSLELGGLAEVAFSFDLTDVVGVQLTEVHTPTGPQAIDYAATVTEVISDAQYAYDYFFDGQPGDVVTIDAQRMDNDLDLSLRLLDEQGTVIAANEDVGQGETPTDARIEAFTLPAAGSYTITVTRFQEEVGASSGSFALTLTKAEGAAVEPLVGQPIAFGDVVSGVINDDAPLLNYVFSGEQGAVITIALVRQNDTDDLDTYLVLLDAAGNQLASNDDAPDPAGVTSTNSRISGYRLPGTGDYTIAAARFQAEAGLTQGAFELSLMLDDTPATDTGAGEIRVEIVSQNSGSVSMDGAVYEDLFPGDDVRGTAYQSFLTFDLPPLADLERATLLLGECLLNGDPFTVLGPLGVEAITYDQLDAAAFGPSDSDLLLGSIDTCPAAEVDVTAVVTQAIQAGAGRVQFRLVFAESSQPGTIDDVTFGVPQLLLQGTESDG
ncbi:hypothetical protein ACFLYO_00110 [Chloroflexota bacterium]